MIRFSVVIPLFNKEEDIYSTIDSVLKQTYNNFELIIIDDGSTDSSIDIVKTIKDNRIKIFQKKNEGVSSARNFGVEKSSFEHIAFLDGDDYWYPNHLEILNHLIAKFPNHLWYAAAYEKNRNGKLTTKIDSPILENGKNWSGEIKDFFNYSFKDSLVNSSSVCLKKDFFIDLKGFIQNITHGEDTDLWIRAAINSSLVFSNKITSRHNLKSKNRSSKVPITKRSITDINKFLEEEKRNPSLKKYLDLNRYSLIIKSKLSGIESQTTKAYIKKIDVKNLNKKQQFLIKQNKFTLQIFFLFQKSLEKLGVRLSSF